MRRSMRRRAGRTSPTCKTNSQWASLSWTTGLSPGSKYVVDENDSDVDDELSEEVNDLINRIDVLRHHVDDLRLNAEDPILARRELRNIIEEVATQRRRRGCTRRTGRVMPAEDSFLTVAEVASILKLNQQTVRNWVDQGALA
jgi:hypothetical protein